MDVVSLILPGLASTAAVSPLPGCGVLSDVSNLLRIGDEGLRYCSSILSIGTIVDPVYSTVTAILTTTISEVTLTDIEIVNTILSAGTSYITADEDVIVTETYTDTSVVLACPTPAGNAPQHRFSTHHIFQQHNIVKQYLTIECPGIFKQCRVTKQHPIIPKHPVPNSRYALAHPNFEPSLLSLSHPNTNTNILPAPISIMFHCARRPCPSSVRYDDAHTHAGGVYYEDGHGVPV
ncbi:hypothetical protein HBI24_115200 [Parastagonospora nodorum]|nr:hypothetical protein HBH54_130410 [Parastagonospora nodorum]KAH4023973.1 hypothetical protein HBI13_081470 [Parastagonospora nodorum]KAH4160520.1 hypothetical protein HBH44_097760 [Parastagonospora nodorum]KAH4556883.1 hypothetical protein HBH84_229260 [Parastagonospora nodorum]KAH4630890.1 hypothetical protein HBH55_089940 [Parastagonospora nodorum]